MAVDVDAVLLDRVFQPCVDRASNWASSFGLARGSLVIAVEAQFLTLFWDAVRDTSAFNIGFTGLSAGLTIVGAVQAWKMIMRAERQARPGTMNVRRLTLRGQRVTWLGVCLLCSCVLVPVGDVRAASSILACAAWVALIYFLSCTSRPPAQRRAAFRSTPAPVAC